MEGVAASVNNNIKTNGRRKRTERTLRLGSQQTHDMTADNIMTNTEDSDNESVEVQYEKASAMLTAVDVNKLVESSVQSQSIL